eukprot:scaffold36673_cov35-Phaeocystis_antarctica.AAC.1
MRVGPVHRASKPERATRRATSPPFARYERLWQSSEGTAGGGWAGAPQARSIAHSLKIKPPPH